MTRASWLPPDLILMLNWLIHDGDRLQLILLEPSFSDGSLNTGITKAHELTVKDKKRWQTGPKATVMEMNVHPVERFGA